MARPLRIEMADVVYHVTSRGLERREIVHDDADRARGSEARAVALHLCRRLTWEPVAKLGERFGGVSAQAVCNLAARVAEQRRSARRLDAPLAAIEHALRLKCRT